MDIIKKISEYFEIEAEEITEESTFEELEITKSSLEEFLYDLDLNEDEVEKIVRKYDDLTIEDLNRFL